MTKSNFFNRTIILKLYSNIYFLFKTIEWFLDLNFKILEILNIERHFEADNEIVWLNRLEIQIPDEFFFQHDPVRAYKIANISPVSMIFRRKLVYGLWELISSSEQNWAVYNNYFPTNSTKIFRLKMVSWPGIA